MGAPRNIAKYAQLHTWFNLLEESYSINMLHHPQKSGLEAMLEVEHLLSLEAKETKIDFYFRA